MIYIESVRRDFKEQDAAVYPYTIPSIRGLSVLDFRKDVTFIIGENGSGKSTLMEAIAINAGYNAEGGGRNFNFSSGAHHSNLFENIKLIRSAYRNKDGFFLRAESFFNVATQVDELGVDVGAFYGGSLHEQSHGESFLALVQNRLFGKGLYLFDEPESALSVNSLFQLMVRIKELVDLESQFIIATHSPILLAYPNADIVQLSETGMERIAYEDTEIFKLTKLFLNNHRGFLDRLIL